MALSTAHLRDALMGYQPQRDPRRSRPRPPGSAPAREPFVSLVGPPPWIMRGENGLWSFAAIVALALGASFLVLG